MMAAAVDLIAAALANPSYGVGVQLDAIPLAPGDTAPEPGVIVTPFTSDKIARGEIPPGNSFLIVVPDGMVSIDQSAPVPTTLARSVRVRVALVSKTGGDTARAVRNASYTLRAVSWALSQWGNKSPQADRQLRGINVHGIVTTEVLDPVEAAGGATVQGMVTVILDCRDVGTPVVL